MPCPTTSAEIVIEVTEHEALSEDEAVREALRDLRARGARIAVDDAGAGYSGLKQLTQVQPDIVKLDRILTEGIHGDPARMALVESFVRFARRTGALVCAEGIETLDEIAALADLDVEWGQGYALGRPDRALGQGARSRRARLPRGAGRGDAARARGAGDDRRRRPRAGADQRPLRRHPHRATTWRTRCRCWAPRSTPTRSRSRACTPRKGCWRPSPRPVRSIARCSTSASTR